jgi:hypothetical protein
MNDQLATFDPKNQISNNLQPQQVIILKVATINTTLTKAKKSLSTPTEVFNIIHVLSF